MNPKPDDLKMLTSKYKTMNIEELKASIDNLGENNDCSNQFQSIDIAKNELEHKYKERQEQIELLTQSLSSSSRVGRWITSISGVFKQFRESKN
ncbi:hypothetical protein [Prochlorococcus marinus]|uniref:hypothetical protein n=1 Tax=Prochlorococcus marinus TaxID=1219 RepID=UPI0022B31458|nr:hypothetical protein [Prochlorococcus marinus]